MHSPSPLDTNAALIRTELARAGARPSPRRHRLVDTPGWVHDTCPDSFTVDLVTDPYVERLCVRCGYRTYHGLDGHLLGHHGGNGLMLLRRQDALGDIVLSDFPDRHCFEHAFTRLLGPVWSSYSVFVVREPQYERGVFQLTPMRGELSDLDDTPLRAALLGQQRDVERIWAGWRQLVAEQLGLPLPSESRGLTFSDHGASEHGFFLDGRSYTLMVNWKAAPHKPNIHVTIAGSAGSWDSAHEQG